MSENAMLAIVLSVAISSCTACTISDRIQQNAMTPQQICVKQATFHTDRLKCLECR